MRQIGAREYVTDTVLIEDYDDDQQRLCAGIPCHQDRPVGYLRDFPDDL